MTPKEKAQNLVDEFRFIIQDEDTECGNEILCTLIAKKCAKLAVEKILLANPTWFVDQRQSTHKYWENVLKQIEKI